MTISVRTIVRGSEEAASIEAYLDSRVGVSFTSSVSRRDVAAVYLSDGNWLRIERFSMGPMTPYIASIGYNSSSGVTSVEGFGSVPLERGVASFVLPEGVSILTATMGDYGGDGIRDIVLRLSDGAFMLIESEGEESSGPRPNNQQITPSPPTPAAAGSGSSDGSAPPEEIDESPPTGAPRGGTPGSGSDSPTPSRPQTEEDSGSVEETQLLNDLLRGI